MAQNSDQLAGFNQIWNGAIPLKLRFEMGERPTHLDHTLPVLLTFLGFVLIDRLAYALSSRVIPKEIRTSRNRFLFASKIASTINALVVVYFSLIALQDEHLKKDPLFGYIPLGSYLFSFATGYFLYDAVWCILFFKEFGWGFLFHGLACFGVYSITLNGFLMYYGAVFLLFEVSTVFLNNHWFLEKLAPEKQFLKSLNSMSLLLSYFVFRIAYGLWQSYYFIFDFLDLHHRIPDAVFYYMLAANVTLNALNLHWFTLLLSKAAATFFPKPPKKGSKTSDAKKTR